MVVYSEEVFNEPIRHKRLVKVPTFVSREDVVRKKNIIVELDIITSLYFLDHVFTRIDFLTTEDYNT